MTVIFLKVLSIFSLLGLGVLLNKTRVLPIESVKYLSAFILTVTNPCLNFSSMVALPFDNNMIRPIIETSVGINIFYLFGFIIAILTIKAIKNIPKEHIGIIICTIVTVNSGFLGFPVTKSIFGDDFLFFMVIGNAASCIMFFVMIPYFLEIGSQSKTGGNPGKYIGAIVKNPPIIGCVLGLIFFFNSIPVPSMVNDVVDMVGNITPPLSMIVIGVQLGEVKLSEIISDFAINISCFIKLIVLPLFVLLITFNMPISTYTKVILTLSASFPMATVTSVYASKLHKNEKLTASAVALSTSLSVITLPVWCIILSFVYL